MSSNLPKTIVSGTIGKISGKIKPFQWARDISCNELSCKETRRWQIILKGKGARNAAVERYRLSQNNIPFQPQDNSVSIGKNSQIKPRKSEQGQGVKIILREYDNYQ